MPSEFDQSGPIPSTDRTRLWPTDEWKVSVSGQDKVPRLAQMYLPGITDREHQRVLFLSLAAGLERGVGDMLIERVLPVFLEAQGGEKLRLPRLDNHPELLHALVRWADHWHLRSASGDEWTIQWAHLALHYGVMRDDFRDLVYLLPAVEVPWLPAPESFPDYDPGSELRSGYLERAEQRWDAWLQVQPVPQREAARQLNMWAQIKEADLLPYCLRVEVAYGRLGWREASDRPKLQTHISWAALWQVLGQRHAEVAEQAGVELKTVREVLPPLLKNIGLRPRRGPGRPRRGS